MNIIKDCSHVMECIIVLGVYSTLSDELKIEASMNTDGEMPYSNKYSRLKNFVVWQFF